MRATIASRPLLKPLALSVAMALGLSLGGCAYYDDDYYDGYYYDGYYGPAYYDFWYDGYYGPYYNGYWGGDGFFYYSDRHRNRFFRDRGRHFRHDRFEGARRYHGRMHDGYRRH